MTTTLFESIKHIDENNNEYWSARELQKVLEYKQWRRFEETINRAKEACINSNNSLLEHFANIGKLSNRANNAEVIISDYKLTRYACYLIAQNGDSRKKVIAQAQTYFAVQTRKQELTDLEYQKLSEIKKRLYQRKITKEGNYILQHVASKAGVKNMDKFHNAGYMGLYNGETANDIAKRKNLRYREDILDNMSSDELAANIFRISQTKQKIQNEKIEGETNTCNTHYEVGKKVRDTIKELGGTMPEKLETPNKSLKELEKSKRGKIIKYLE